MTRGPAGLPGHLSGLGRPLVMGILNVTPDSFSDGGRWAEPAAAVDRGLALAAEGADLVDVGGESTRPGAGRVDEAEELRRVLPVVRGLADAGVAVSIDTTRADVARACVEAGAVLVNDVSGGLADAAMAAAVAALGCPYLVMHWRGPSADMARHARYADVAGEVATELRERVRAAEAAGVDPARVVVDPGVGFAKDAGHNWELLARLGTVAALGRPVAVGVSRKRFLGALLAADDGTPRPVGGRDTASAALAALLAAQGVWSVRAHDAAATRDAVAVGAAWAVAGTVAAGGTPRAPLRVPVAVGAAT